MYINRIYTITMDNGNVWGVPAEIIAKNYASYYQSLGENYQENFDAMIGWFDKKDYEFADWAKNNMDWSDVCNEAFLFKTKEDSCNFQDGWVNGEYGYVCESKGE